MRKMVYPAYRWFLERFPEDVEELSEIPGERNFLDVVEGSAGYDRFKLHVPSGLIVYQVIKPLRIKGHLFFCLREFDGAHAQSYLSVVEREKGKFNLSEDSASLLRYPWFDAQQTNYIFERIMTTDGNAVFWGRNPNAIDPHPFLGDKGFVEGSQ